MNHRCSASACYETRAFPIDFFCRRGKDIQLTDKMFVAFSGEECLFEFLLCAPFVGKLCESVNIINS